MSTTRDTEKVAVEHQENREPHSLEKTDLKTDISEDQVEHVNTNSDSGDDVDFNNHNLNNKYAIKGDNSDGKVVWNWKTRIAAFSLVLLYVGKCATLWTRHLIKSSAGSQLPLYFIGGSIAFVVKEIGGGDKESWLPVAATLAVAATCPFSGYLQDLMGRRNITLFGCVLLLVGIGLVGKS